LSIRHLNIHSNFEFRHSNFPAASRICMFSADKWNTDETSVGGSMMQPSDRGQHCPFLNRADSRCGTHFTLERLEHAFAYCFDRYTACPTYLELLVERRVRRGEPVHAETSHEAQPLVQLNIHTKMPAKFGERIGSPAPIAPNRAA
jgi:hypothetical protein